MPSEANQRPTQPNPSARERKRPETERHHTDFQISSTNRKIHTLPRKSTSIIKRSHYVRLHYSYTLSSRNTTLLQINHSCRDASFDLLFEPPAANSRGEAVAAGWTPNSVGCTPIPNGLPCFSQVPSAITNQTTTSCVASKKTLLCDDPRTRPIQVCNCDDDLPSLLHSIACPAIAHNCNATTSERIRPPFAPLHELTAGNSPG